MSKFMEQQWTEMGSLITLHFFTEKPLLANMKWEKEGLRCDSRKQGISITTAHIGLSSPCPLLLFFPKSQVFDFTKAPLTEI